MDGYRGINGDTGEQLKKRLVGLIKGFFGSSSMNLTGYSRPESCFMCLMLSGGEKHLQLTKYRRR